MVMKYVMGKQIYWKIILTQLFLRLKNSMLLVEIFFTFNYLIEIINLNFSDIFYLFIAKAFISPYIATEISILLIYGKFILFYNVIRILWIHSNNKVNAYKYILSRINSMNLLLFFTCYFFFNSEQTSFSINAMKFLSQVLFFPIFSLCWHSENFFQFY